jgi:ABC-type transport system involved in multi-copper enzyme maturation permease subunit
MKPPLDILNGNYIAGTLIGAVISLPTTAGILGLTGYSLDRDLLPLVVIGIGIYVFIAGLVSWALGGSPLSRS